MIHLNESRRALGDGPSMDSNLLRLADAAAPRYTSYPTAQKFADGVGPADVEARLETLGGQPVSVYLHVPFCRRLCWFCGCNTGVANDDAPLLRYAGLLRDEIAMVADRIGESAPVVTHLHWGGGTPTILPAPAFRAVMAQLRDRFSFAPDAEIATEIDPRTLTDETVEALAAAGINRASLGVQDFTPHVQEALNRFQAPELVAEVMAKLRAAGITRINLDIMYGLPRQTLEDAAETAAIAADLRPDRVAVFGYAHVPWFMQRQTLISEADLPGGATRLAQAEAMGATLAAHGFARIGLDHFAQPDDSMAAATREGRLHRNFQGYTVDESPVMLGFGASSIGAFDDLYYQNVKGGPDYAAAVQAGRLPVARGVALSADDRLRRSTIERVMCDLRVDLAAICTDHGAPETALDDALPRLARLAEDGLVKMEGRRIEVPWTARAFLRPIAMCFDAYAAAEGVSGSRAV